MGLGSERDSDKNSKLQRYLCAVKNIKAYLFQMYTIFKQESQLSKKYNSEILRNVSFVFRSTCVGPLHTSGYKKVNSLWTGLLTNYGSILCMGKKFTASPKTAAPLPPSSDHSVPRALPQCKTA